MKGSLFIGPYFFEDASELKIASYRRNLQRNVESIYCHSLLGELNLQNFYFQQDGATPHTARETGNAEKAFPGRLISGSGDLSKLDFARFFIVGMPEI